MNIGINASRARSGGGKAHLKGILSNFKPKDYNIKKIHVFSYQELLDSLPNYSWLIKHCPKELSKSLIFQLWWEKFRLPNILIKTECNILLNVDAGSVCKFSPAITMSRDMLSYEPGEMQRYKFSLTWLRLLVLKYVQNSSLKRASGAVFLTNYAANIIQKSCGRLENFKVIPHGVSDSFRAKPKIIKKDQTDTLNLLYVSNVDLYKHQWHVVSAAEILKSKGVQLKLTLVGGGSGVANHRLIKQIKKSDPLKEYIVCLPFLNHEEIPKLLHAADLFVFASSCENMPNTLIEAMAAGLPIVCSNRGPMPEVLGETGIYFDPESPTSIASAIYKMALDNRKRINFAKKSFLRSNIFSWKNCSDLTWKFISSTLLSKNR